LKKPPSAEGGKKTFSYTRTETNATERIKKPPSAEEGKKPTDVIQHIESRRTQRLEGQSAAEGPRTGPLRRSTPEDRTPLRGAPPSSGAHHPRGAIPRPPSDLHAQVLPSDLMSPLEHRVFSSPVAWPSHTHTHVRVTTRVYLGPFSTRPRASPLTANLLSPLVLISSLISRGNNRRSILVALY
jgi:hypothetical protein